jgi:RNA exonuclease 1
MPHAHHVVGEKLRIYTCCSRPTSEGGGCVRGPHVFYETDPEALHLRHTFSFSRRAKHSADGEVSASSTSVDTALDVAAIDCEMVYTTGGMRCARVSVVDGSGAEVFDELVRMDDGVEVMYVDLCSVITFRLSETCDTVTTSLAFLA